MEERFIVFAYMDYGTGGGFNDYFISLTKIEDFNEELLADEDWDTYTIYDKVRDINVDVSMAVICLRFDFIHDLFNDNIDINVINANYKGEVINNYNYCIGVDVLERFPIKE